MQKVFVLLVIVAVSSSLQHPFKTEVQTTVESVTQSKYVLPFFKANWFKAVEYCNYLSLRLAIIDSKEKEASLYAAIKASDISSGVGLRIWVGASDLADNGEYHWHDTGKPVVYANWADSQPDNAGQMEHCLEVIFNEVQGWNDMECKAKRYFACE